MKYIPNIPHCSVSSPIATSDITGSILFWTLGHTIPISQIFYYDLPYKSFTNSGHKSLRIKIHFRTPGYMSGVRNDLRRRVSHPIRCRKNTLLYVCGMLTFFLNVSICNYDSFFFFSTNERRWEVSKMREHIKIQVDSICHSFRYD